MCHSQPASRRRDSDSARNPIHRSAGHAAMPSPPSRQREWRLLRAAKECEPRRPCRRTPQAPTAHQLPAVGFTVPPASQIQPAIKTTPHAPSVNVSQRLAMRQGHLRCRPPNHPRSHPRSHIPRLGSISIRVGLMATGRARRRVSPIPLPASSQHKRRVHLVPNPTAPGLLSRWQPCLPNFAFRSSVPSPT